MILLKIACAHPQIISTYVQIFQTIPCSNKKNVYKWDKIVNTDEQTDSHRRIPRGDRVFYLSAVGKPAKISLYVN